MNRREAIAAGVSLITASSLPAQTITGVNGTYTISTPVDKPLAERRKQYAVCKERGHVAEEPNAFLVNAVYREPGYVEFSRCKFCGTGFRFTTATTLEEANKP